ncbi:unnamed protein product, partial [Scytosiphon promiscuus]
GEAGNTVVFSKKKSVEATESESGRSSTEGMKLEAAAAVLGVAVDADPETLKAAYRRLALRWHPDKCKEADAKERFQEVSVAYTRLVSGESGRDHEGDGSERFYDDVEEMRAFMSMFMELVGMFGNDMPNGCGPGCKGGHVHAPPGMPPDMDMPPSASVAFSMMFGERPQEEVRARGSSVGRTFGRAISDGWREICLGRCPILPPYNAVDIFFVRSVESQLLPTSFLGDVNVFGGSALLVLLFKCFQGTPLDHPALLAATDANFSHLHAIAGTEAGLGEAQCLWEPMVRHYFHMNLKEEVEQQRAAGQGSAGMVVSEEVQLEEEELRQARALKKRQDKKRRQKEKKQQRASAARVQEAADRRDAQQEEGKRDDEVSASEKRKEMVRLKRKAEEERRVGLFTACRAGFVEEVRLMLGTGLIKCTERERENGASGASLLHSCVTDFAGSPDNAPQLKELAIDRLSIAAMVLASVDPAVDAGWVDSAGLTVLHRVSEALDLPYLALLLEERQKSQERRDQILLNERCLLKGWTPLHYAAAEGSPAAVSTLLAVGASVNVDGAVLDGIDCNSNGGRNSGGGGGVGSGGDGGTALQLVRALLSKEGAGPRKKGLQEVARQLSAATQAVERAKEQRERKEREAKLAKKRSEVQKEKKKEARERELLSRKQRQLKDKQERQEREERQEEERRGRKEEQGRAEEAGGKSKKGKKSKKKKNAGGSKPGGGDDDNVTERGMTAAAADAGAAGAAATNGGRKEEGETLPGRGSSGHNARPVSPAASSRTQASGAGSAAGGGGGAGSAAAPVVSESVHESSMSRDDLLAQLITMGFQEEHVHRGTSCVGFDLNALLSWLVDHPDGGSTPAEQASAAASSKAATNARRKGPASKAKAKIDAGKGNSGVISSAIRNHGHGGGALAGIAVSGGEKKRHNLELRRINRAWNASLPLRRAEEEVRAGFICVGRNGEGKGIGRRQGREASPHRFAEVR